MGLGPLRGGGRVNQTRVTSTRPRVFILPDETGDVDVHKGGHEVLAVEAVHDASVTRDRVGKILTGNRSSFYDWTTGTVGSNYLVQMQNN